MSEPTDHHSARFNPCARGHAVQFYEDAAYLADVVARHLGDGLSAGRPGLVIATPQHQDRFREALVRRGVDAAAEIAHGRLVFLDARETLARLMVGLLPDRLHFRQVMGELFARFPPGVTVHAYGEMVDLLVRSRNAAAALLLEDQWNELSQTNSFRLLCGYALSSFDSVADAGDFQEVCSVHHEVAPTEKYAAISSEHGRSLEIAILQQRAKALESEIEQRQRVERELLHSLQMRDDFLAVAGHELKTPLTALQLQLHSLGVHARDADGRVAQSLQRANRQLRRLSSLTDELLDVSRISTGRLVLEREVFDFGQLLQEVLEREAEAVARSKCEVSMAIEGSARGKWDKFRIEQVVTNLLCNALKYAAGKEVRLSLRAVSERLQFTVRDGGMGIPLEDQARIFERFERAVPMRHFGGLGLGLWITRQVVEAHGGVVRVESQLGAGATFTVELPMTEA